MDAGVSLEPSEIRGKSITRGQQHIGKLKISMLDTETEFLRGLEPRGGGVKMMQ